MSAIPPAPVPEDLHILSAKNALLSLHVSPPLPSRDPSHLSPALTAHLSHLRKQKFQYLELNAKDKFIKTIVSDTDDAPLVTASTNEALTRINEHKKVALRDAKARLSEKQADVRKHASLTEQEHIEATSVTAEFSSLTKSILDARLALTRLRQTHPSPKLTIPSALAHLDAQSTSLQTLDEELSSLRRQVAAAKDRIKVEGRAIEQLRAERADLTKAVRDHSKADEDSSLVPIYDWYMNSLALHRGMHGLLSFQAPAENELHLTYLIHTTRLTLILLFHPNTRLLASASCSPPLDISGLVERCVESSDVAGLVSDILLLARTTPM